MTKKILITSALPYVNNIPHLGNIIGCVLSADVFARYARLKHGKDQVLYVCGSDEHGTATETKAKEEGVSPQELCDKYYAIHKEVYEWFNISFDIFGRTSLSEHAAMTRELFERVNEQGFVSEEEITQPFCMTCNSFLADRFIKGTCPFCGYEDARGDQCDHCGKLLNPAELQYPRCSADNSTPEFRKTKHLFLALDTLQPELEAWVDAQSKTGFWTQNSIRTTKAWFKEGLKKRAITRDLKWGINLPESAFGGRYKDKVFYVWFDAPIGYISITKQLLGAGWKDWWLEENADVDLYQFMGKDNIPFHSIIFPATLLAANKTSRTAVDSLTDNKSFRLVHHLNATEYLNYEYTKFSKSRGVGIFGTDAKDTGIPADVFRYVLCYYRPEQADTQFTWKGLQERVNNELVANFGNFVNRTLTFTTRFFDGQVAAIDERSLDEDTLLRVASWRSEVKHMVSLLDTVRIKEALMAFMKLSAAGNAFFQEAAPWKTKDEHPEKAKQDVALLVHMVKDLAILAQPFLPDTSQRIFAQLNWPVSGLDDVGVLSMKNHVIGEPEILFKKIEDDQITLLREKFAGTQETRKQQEEKTMQQENEEKTTADASPALQLSDVDLRVGKIIKVLPHPNAEKLYIEHVDLGDDEPVQIVSGLVGHYTPESLVGQHIIVVKNLKPAKLRGEMSYGMLLAAEDAAKTVGLILAPDAVIGARVVTKDIVGEPKKEITIDEFFSLTFRLADGMVYCGADELFADEKKLIADKNLTSGSIQ
jgi:methionyl-tRNA synthetase